MFPTIRNQLACRFSDGEARVLCYAGGPVSGVVLLYLRRYSEDWSIRFHAFHSLLMSALWAISWCALRLMEEISPWFLSVLARETRFILDVAFLLLWAGMLVSAYRGSRFAAVPFIHSMAVRYARKFEKYRWARP